MKLKITQVEVVLPTRLRITWENGKHTEVDAGDYMHTPGYERLRDSVFFASVQVEEWGHGVEWPVADIGIPADALYRLSKEQSGDAFPTGQFNAWMKRHGLSLSAAAEALHLTRRTIITAPAPSQSRLTSALPAKAGKWDVGLMPRKSPSRGPQARRLQRIQDQVAEAIKLARAVKTVLAAAVKTGGTTLRDYVNADGYPGYFKQRL